MRETVSGGAEACRQKALAHVNSVKATFNENTTDEEKFQAFLSKFQRVAHGVSRCRENFQEENYKRWLEDKRTAGALAECNREGIILMEMLTEEMKPLMSSTENKPLATVNGTSLAFTECTQLYIQAQKDFVDTDAKLHEKILCDRPLSEQPIILQKLEAVIASVMAYFAFVPDLLLT